MLAEIDQRHVVTEELSLAGGANAFVARPDGSGQHPAIILLHERYGVVRHTRDLAIRLAADGYLALAPNLYFRAPDPGAVERGEVRAVVSDEEVAHDIGAAIDYLKQLEVADTSHLAVWGACASGRYPLIASAARHDVVACVIFYGAAYDRDWFPDAVTDYVGRSSAPILGVYGELDHLNPRQGIFRFRNALEEARRSYHIKIFRNARHAFLDDTMPNRYERLLAEEAWGLLMGFLARVRSGGYPSDRVQWTFDADYDPEYDSAKLQPVTTSNT